MVVTAVTAGVTVTTAGAVANGRRAMPMTYRMPTHDGRLVVIATERPRPRAAGCDG